MFGTLLGLRPARKPNHNPVGLLEKNHELLGELKRERAWRRELEQQLADLKERLDD